MMLAWLVAHVHAVLETSEENGSLQTNLSSGCNGLSTTDCEGHKQTASHPLSQICITLVTRHVQMEQSEPTSSSNQDGSSDEALHRHELNCQLLCIVMSVCMFIK